MSHGGSQLALKRELKNHHPKNHSQHDTKTEKHSEKLHDIFGEIS